MYRFLLICCLLDLSFTTAKWPDVQLRFDVGGGRYLQSQVMPVRQANWTTMDADSQREAESACRMWRLNRVQNTHTDSYVHRRLGSITPNIQTSMSSYDTALGTPMKWQASSAVRFSLLNRHDTLLIVPPSSQPRLCSP
jgi:hypothetical protein